MGNSEGHVSADLPVEREEPPIEDLSIAVYEVPTDLPEGDGTITWDATTVVVVEVRCQGRVGTGWTYAAAAARSVIDEILSRHVVGHGAFDLVGVHEQMVRACRNIGRQGIASCAISAVDVALWDLKAQLLGCSLADLFGACRTSVPIYGSGGFTTYSDHTTTAQLEHWTNELGAAQVKIKVGESWGSEPARDLHRVRLARRVVGEDVALFVDANGGYARKQAIALGRRFLSDSGVSWFEEPVSSDDLEGLRKVRDQLACDVTAGEYGYDEPYFARLLTAGAVDCVQIDVTRCGGYTSWLRIAGLAGAHGLEVSGHCAPALHAPVTAAIPNLRHVEYFHDHERLEPMLFSGCPVVRDGSLQVPRDVLGHGMALREQAPFRVA